MDMGLTDKQLDKLYGRDIPENEPFEIHLMRKWMPITTEGWNFIAERINSIWENDEEQLMRFHLYTQRAYYPTRWGTLKKWLSERL